MKNLLSPPAVAAALAAARRIREWLADPDLADWDDVRVAFRELAGLIEALPPDAAGLGLVAYLRNRVRSSAGLWWLGEWGAAEYQMAELVLKLARAAG